MISALPFIYSIIPLICSSVYFKFLSAVDIASFTILKYPPPANFLNFTSAKSGSTPVVAQSINKPIVPVGASKVVCALR